MQNIIIAESGSTKTDWIWVANGKKTKFQCSGIHPYLQTKDEIINLLQQAFPKKLEKERIEKIEFYGAGINSPESKSIIIAAFKHHFKKTEIKAYSDMEAAARACCGTEKGFVSILGTGSNSCYYDGKKIKDKQVSLGYILGDEGSGNHIGKKILQYYFHDIMDAELKSDFDKKFATNLNEVLECVYRKSFANRYLASFASFAFEHRGHYLIENIIEDSLNEFFINHILPYKNIEKYPLHFVGSVAFLAKDAIKELCRHYNIEMGKIIQKPMDTLFENFYKSTTSL